MKVIYAFIVTGLSYTNVKNCFNLYAKCSYAFSVGQNVITHVICDVTDWNRKATILCLSLLNARIFTIAVYNPSFIFCYVLILFILMCLMLLSPKLNFDFCDLCYSQFYRSFSLERIMLPVIQVVCVFSVNTTWMFQNQSNSSGANLCRPTSSLTRSNVYRMFVVSFDFQYFLIF